jgi:hypothetical protein
MPRIMPLTFVFGRAFGGICRLAQLMLVNVISMHVVQMVVVQVVRVILMTNGFVSAIIAMFVFVFFVYRTTHTFSPMPLIAFLKTGYFENENCFQNQYRRRFPIFSV